MQGTQLYSLNKKDNLKHLETQFYLFPNLLPPRMRVHVCMCVRLCVFVCIYAYKFYSPLEEWKWILFYDFFFLFFSDLIR